MRDGPYSSAAPLGMPVLQEMGQHITSGGIHGYFQFGRALLGLLCPPALRIPSGLFRSIRTDILLDGIPGFGDGCLYDLCRELTLFLHLLVHSFRQLVNLDLSIAHRLTSPQALL